MTSSDAEDQQDILNLFNYRGKAEYTDNNWNPPREVARRIGDITSRNGNWRPDEGYPNDTLWRYMNFSKFVNLIQSNELWFSNVQEFNDPYEGTVPMRNAKERTFDVLKEAEDLINSRDHDYKLAIGDMEKLAYKPIIDAYISCWTIRNTESLALWEQYVEGENGVAIKTDVESLLDSLDLPRDAITHGKVRYKDYTSFKLPKGELPIVYHKRDSFEHEKEYRLCYLDDPWKEDVRSGDSIKVELNDMIDELYLSPRSNERFADSIIDLMNTYDLECDVQRSSIYSDPRSFYR